MEYDDLSGIARRSDRIESIIPWTKNIGMDRRTTRAKSTSSFLQKHK